MYVLYCIYTIFFIYIVHKNRRRKKKSPSKQLMVNTMAKYDINAMLFDKKEKSLNVWEKKKPKSRRQDINSWSLSHSSLPPCGYFEENKIRKIYALLTKTVSLFISQHTPLSAASCIHRLGISCLAWVVCGVSLFEVKCWRK